jgi:hypothetical protein
MSRSETQDNAGSNWRANERGRRRETYLRRTRASALRLLVCGGVALTSLCLHGGARRFFVFACALGRSRVREKVKGRQRCKAWPRQPKDRDSSPEASRGNVKPKAWRRKREKKAKGPSGVLTWTCVRLWETPSLPQTQHQLGVMAPVRDMPFCKRATKGTESPLCCGDIQGH